MDVNFHLQKCFWILHKKLADKIQSKKDNGIKVLPSCQLGLKNVCGVWKHPLTFCNGYFFPLLTCVKYFTRELCITQHTVAHNRHFLLTSKKQTKHDFHFFCSHSWCNVGLEQYGFRSFLIWYSPHFFAKFPYKQWIRGP